MTEEPSLPEQAKNITKTAYDIVKGFVFNGMLLVPDEVKKARIDKFSDKGGETESIQATVFDRNDLLKIIKGDKED